MVAFSSLRVLARAAITCIPFFISLTHLFAFDEHSSRARTTITSPFPLTTHPEADFMPAISADGKWLAYVSRQNGNYDIWVRATAGGLPSLLTTNTSDDYSPSWSPDNKALVFVSRRDDAEGDLYLLQLEEREDGFAPSKTKRLTANLQREAFPHFSPDGKKIAYSFGAKGAEQVWLYEIKTGAHYQLTTRGGTEPTWSPNGSELAIAARAGEMNEQQIFIISADTTQADYLRRQITFDGDNHFPTWSPEGKRILVQREAVVAGKNKIRSRLYVVPLDLNAGSLEQLSAGLQITPDSEDALFPCWSREGMVYYAAARYGNLDLWRIPESGPIPHFATPAAAFAHAQTIATHEAAVLAFSALRYHFPDSTRWLALAGVEMGRRYLSMDETEQARKIWNNVALYYLGENEGAGFAELELAKLDDNQERFALLYERYRTWPRVQALCLLEQGLALQQQRQYESALRIFQTVSQTFPQLREVKFRAERSSAEVLLQLERMEDAEARYAALIADYREHSDWSASAISRLLAIAPQLARASDTLAAYQRLQQRHAAQPEIAFAARFGIAEKLQHDGEIQLAENEWRDIISALASLAEPNLRALRARALQYLLRLQIARNDLPPAQALYEQLAKEHETPAEREVVQSARADLTQALLRRGRLLLLARDLQLALAAFRQARNYDAAEVETHRGYIETMNGLDQIDDAVAEYEQLAQQQPRNEILLYALGLAYSYKGVGHAQTLRRSSSVIEAALALNYRLVPAYLTLGFNYEGIEQLEQKERERKKNFFERLAFALPGFLDNLRRTLTFRPPKPQARWYERALEALTMAIALNDETTHPQREAQLALNLANIYYNLGEFAAQNAFRYYQIKQRYDSTFVAPRQRAVILERMGETGWLSGKYQEAAPYLREAVQQYQRLRDPEGELRNLLRLALLYQTSGDLNTSNEYFRDFITASRRENRENNLAQVWRTIARNHQQQAEPDEALKRSQRALRLLETQDRDNFPQPEKSKLTIKLLGLPIFWHTLAPTGEESNTEGLTFEQERELVFTIMEESHATQKDFEAAIAELEKKLTSFRERQDRKGEALAHNNLGTLWYNLHEFKRAHAHYSASLQICAAHDFAGGLLSNLTNLGNLALLRERTGDAAIPTTSAFVDSLMPRAMAVLPQAPEAQQLAVWALRGNLAYHRAAELWPQAYDTDDDSSANTVAREVRQTVLATQYFAQARRAYEEALVLAERGRSSREEIILRRNLAGLFVLVQDFPAAWAHLRLAHERSIAKNLPHLTWRIEHALGVLTQIAPQHSFSTNSALAWYQRAIALLENLPEEPEGVEQRLAESEEQNALYENTIAVLAKAAENEEPLRAQAFVLAERKQARHFMKLSTLRYILPHEQSQRRIWGGTGGEVSFFRRELSRLRGELLKLQAEEPQRPKELLRVQAALQKNEAEYQAQVQKAMAEDRAFASFFSVQNVDLQSVRDSLAQNTAIIKYFVAENEIVLWLLARDRLEQRRVPYARTQLRREVETLRRALHENEATIATRAQALSEVLLAPLPHLEDYAQLIIVPDDALHYVPFAALPFRATVLAQRFALTHASSVQALLFAEQRKNLNTEPWLIVQDANTDAPSFATQLEGLQPQTLVGVAWYDGEELHPRIRSAGFLHVQSRLSLLPDRPQDSPFVLRFMQGESLATARLPLYRLFENKLRAGLCVLENTTMPYRVGQTGDELIILQRSMISAGVPSLMMCQWEVAPEIRNFFYAEFYAQVNRTSLVAALQRAQEVTRKQFPHSHAWAAFELIGFPGMNPREKTAFARRYFQERVAIGNNAQDAKEYGDAVQYYREALAMAKQLGEMEAVQHLHLLIKSAAFSGNDFATVSEIETLLLADAQAAQDDKRIAQSLQNLSIWRLRMQDYVAAEKAERAFLSLMQQNNNALGASSSYFRLAQIFQAAGEYEKARSAGKEAAQILATLNQPLPRLQVETFLGRLALEAGNAPLALEDLESALTAFQTARGANALTIAEQRAFATCKQLLGRAYGDLTAYHQALVLHREVLDIFTALADTANLVRAEQYVAETLWLNAEFQAALQHQQRALHWLTFLDKEIALQIRALTTMGLIKLNLGDLPAAVEAQKRALETALTWEEKQPFEARRNQATVHKNLGVTYLQMRQLQPALANFHAARKLDVTLNAVRGLLYDYLNLGSAFLQVQQPDSALFYLTAAETLGMRLQDQRALAKVFFFKGQTALRMQQRDAALAALTRALEHSEKFHVEELSWRCLWELGKISKQEGALETAWEYYQRALAALERMSAKIKIAEYRSGFIDDKTELYEEAVLLLLQMKRESEAFHVAERAKSRSFADMLGNSGVAWQAAQSNDRTLLARREKLLEAIAFAQSKSHVVMEQTFQSNAPDTLAALQKAYSELLLEMKSANAELADAINVEPLPLAEIQSMLADSVALVEYFFAQNRLVCWVIDRAQVRAVSTPLDRTRLAENVTQLRRAITKRASTEIFSRALYDMLLAPLEPLLQQTKQLLIVPHGVLHYLPFPALQRADGSFLIDHHALAFAPSATVLGFCHRKADTQRAARQAPQVLALGNPDLGNPRLDLPFAEKEIKSLEQTFAATKSLLRKQATRRALFAEQSNAALLHFACHGNYDAANPLFSSLLLAAEDSSGIDRLTAHEILTLRLNAQLVMLSACETGLARVTGGDEVIGLTRSFIFAGAPALIASLWTVDDLATAITVKRFYRFLQSGKSKAEALRAAQRFVRDQHNRHPAYWASMTLTGDWR